MKKQKSITSREIIAFAVSLFIFFFIIIFMHLLFYSKSFALFIGMQIIHLLNYITSILNFIKENGFKEIVCLVIATVYAICTYAFLSPNNEKIKKEKPFKFK